MEVRQIIRTLKNAYLEDIIDQIPIPAPWCEDRNQVKAILLGCDPSNRHTQIMPYVFTLGMNIPVFNSFKKAFERDLEVVGLSWNSVYVQNLCRNYFRKETSENRRIWLEASKLWIPVLDEELSKFDTNIPVLLTSDMLFKALVTNPDAYGKTIDFYECRTKFPIDARDNLLNRPLIPFYLGLNGRTKQSYRLGTGKWVKYRKQIIRQIEKEMEV
ncbi:hypothetical protein ACUNWD_04630 [Sunxiuqinia sp. A32]|uniref:hypothetical protein n=1 Tax=Sunxiuqinia sp. A32 TaxID=3461496 RepID=UPI004045EF84